MKILSEVRRTPPAYTYCQANCVLSISERYPWNPLSDRYSTASYRLKWAFGSLKILLAIRNQDPSFRRVHSTYQCTTTGG
jgi:hypothetical protein